MVAGHTGTGGYGIRPEQIPQFLLQIQQQDAQAAYFQSQYQQQMLQQQFMQQQAQQLGNGAVGGTAGRIYTSLSSYHYICVLMPLYMCPHATAGRIYTSLSSYHYICVLIPLYMCPHATAGRSFE